MNDPEIRKFSVLSLGKICCLIINKDLSKEIFTKIINTFLQTINDYTVDKRGDIGLIVRDQTLDSVFEILEKFIEVFNKKELEKYFTEKILQNVFGWYLSQISEPNDK